MKTLFLIALIIFGFTSYAGNPSSSACSGPIANAGPDQTIYLTQTSSVILDGSASSSGTYQWTEVSTDYSSGATISSPNSALTTVTGLPQGVFYFQLAVTSGGATSSAVVIINVDYDVPPSGSLLRTLEISNPNVAAFLNDRSNTTQMSTYYKSLNTSQGPTYYEMCRSNGMSIDSRLAKFTATIEDGYYWTGGSGYARTEVSYGSGYGLDASKNYSFEWKGYFPQDFSYLEVNQPVVTIFQVHGNDGDSPPFGIYMIDGHDGTNQNEGTTGVKGLYLEDADYPVVGDPTVQHYFFLMNLSDMINQAHTIRITLKEGEAGTGAFIKVEIDGVQKYYRNTGRIGRDVVNSLPDYPKFAGIYDHDNAIVDPNNHTRNRKFSLVTESFKVFQLGSNLSPTANAGSNQTIVLPNNSVKLSGNGSSPTSSISGYKWTQISGPGSGTISNPSSANTNVIGLTQGVYKFELEVTDNNGATATSDVQITVKNTNQPPTANAGSNQTITLPTNSVNLSGNGTDADGLISSYQWIKISGPSSASISNSNSASADVSGLTAGTYQFQLTVIDDKGATGTSTVTVTVKALANQPPTANAGPDQTITLPTNTVTLSGSGKDDDGSISSYQWSKFSGPSSASISNSNSASTDVSGLAAGTYQFQLTVTDDKGAKATSTVTVTVKAAPNTPPTANAGSDQTITLPTNSVILSGSGKDLDGIISSYNWTQISGPSSGTINNGNSALANVISLTKGVYQFELKVTDDKGAIGKDTLKITVNQPSNFAPTANAGPNKTINLPLDSIQLKGSGNDIDGTIKSYSWTKISGPLTETISNPDSSSTEVTNLVQGVYKFELQVTDDKGATGTDIVQIRVNAVNNVAPTANAGPDQTILLPTNNITLSGSGNDTDGTVVSYNWTKISGPSAAKIANSNSASTHVTNLSEGVYQFELKVTDDKGDTGNDTVSITVNAPANVPPAADAGSDQAITLPTNSVTLSGSGKDTDGLISSYKWSEATGPSSANIANSNSASTEITGLVKGIYQFQLAITDDKGATATSTVTITVNAAANVSPTAHAGLDQVIALPTNSVALSGTATDSDGTITSYLWKKIAGPAGETINNPSSANTTVDGLIQGDYTFELAVTDNHGATGNDTVLVKVNPAINLPPKAIAGTNQTVVLPTDNVTLRGNGTDADGTIVSYLWIKISGPAGNVISNPTSANIVVSGLVQGIYQFELQVTDNKGGVGKDTLKVTVNAPNNIAPTANAGADKSITLPTNNVTLLGSGSDADGTISSYSWTKISGPAGDKINNPNSANISVSGLVQGIYQFELKVTDNKGDIGTDTVNIKVNPVHNQPPVANAGNDQTISLPTNSITLSGNGTDPDGTIASYGWTKIAGPSAFSIVNSSFAVVTINNLVEGIYKFQLNVTDNNGASAKDTVMVTVTPVKTTANVAPTVNAGSDTSITLPINSITVSGNAADSDGTIASYIWTKISGPSSYTIANPSSSATEISNLKEGVYQFQLEVIDDKGSHTKDTLKITVNASNASTNTTINQPPLANAGSDVTIVSPSNSVTLNGSGIDKDGKITSYNWTQISGPSNSNIVDSTASSTEVAQLIGGTYEFELTVKDNNGAKGKDTVKVTVALERLAPKKSSLNIYPNPVHTVATLEVTTPHTNTFVGIVITDMSGNKVYKKKFVSNPMQVSQNIDMSNLIKGVYVVTVFFDEKQMQSTKVIRL